jgi:Beta-L-arabinofuranosidase, GH127 catalytic domain
MCHHRFVNYMVENFVPSKRPALTGHPEFEMALVELYRTTGDRKYLDFAGYLLSGVERERLHLTDGQVQYMFSGCPLRRAGNSRGTLCAPCTRLPAPPTITPRPVMQPTGARSSAFGATWRTARCTSPAA